jgi:NADH:ubiquinone oxidoreductase subunit E
MAPVVMVNEKVYGKLVQAEVSGMIESERKDETDK